MDISTLIPWNRYGLIAELSFRMKESNLGQFGKTALQKLIFLLQEIYGVNTGYAFSIYTYGPFSSQIMHDLDQVDSMAGVSIQCIASCPGGYHIAPGERNDAIRQKAFSFLKDENVNSAIASLIGDFGGYSAKELELRSTIIYVDREMKKDNMPLDTNDLVNMVQKIKPNFSVSEILKTVSDLKSKTFV